MLLLPRQHFAVICPLENDQPMSDCALALNWELWRSLSAICRRGISCSAFQKSCSRTPISPWSDWQSPSPGSWAGTGSPPSPACSQTCPGQILQHKRQDFNWWEGIVTREFKNRKKPVWWLTAEQLVNFILIERMYSSIKGIIFETSNNVQKHFEHKPRTDQKLQMWRMSRQKEFNSKKFCAFVLQILFVFIQLLFH